VVGNGRAGKFDLKSRPQREPYTMQCKNIFEGQTQVMGRGQNILNIIKYLHTSKNILRARAQLGRELRGLKTLP